MSGHSKWSSIKRKKGTTDERRGKAFTQAARLITIAAREMGTNPETNVKLKLAVERAKSMNVPSATIERAILQASSSKEAEGLEEQVYGAYGPSGSAVMIKAVTDNKNRTSSQLKRILARAHGKLAQSSGVKWMFEERGKVEAAVSDRGKEEIQMIAIENGAIDLENKNESIFVYTKPLSLQKVRKALEKEGVEIKDARIELFARSEVNLDKESKKKFQDLLDALFKDPDVTEVFTNVK